MQALTIEMKSLFEKNMRDKKGVEEQDILPFYAAKP
jgi:hypothetical protein